VGRMRRIIHRSHERTKIQQVDMWIAHLALFREYTLISWLGLVVVVQNIVSSFQLTPVRLRSRLDLCLWCRHARRHCGAVENEASLTWNAVNLKS
jgi:hypothetical protein